MINGGVYRIKNETNGKFYIGSAKHLKKRFSEHKSHLKNNTHPNKHLQASWNKWGADKFTFEIIEFVYGPIKKIREKEQKHLCLVIKNNLWDKCYNIKKSVVLNDNSSFVIRQRKGKTYEEIFGASKANEMRQKQSKIRKFLWTDEKRKDLSKRLSGKNNPFFGKKHSNKTKQIISKRTKGKTFVELYGPEKGREIIEKIKSTKHRRGTENPNYRKNNNGDFIRGKTLEEYYGLEKAKQIKTKKSYAVSKTYTHFCLIDPDGREYHNIKNLRQFSKEHSLISTAIHRMIGRKLKKHHGWTIRFLSSTETAE
jgi:group I intron endonuclease